MNIDGYALVTGAGSGIGRACAHQFAEDGAAGVAFADLDEGSAERAAGESLALATNADYRAISIHVDVTRETDVEAMVRTARAEFGRIDYAVNCAGISAATRRDFADQSFDDFDRVMGVNCNGMFHCVRAEINAMKAQEPRPVSARDPKRGVTRGAIVNMGSVASYSPMPGNSAYVTSKHAVLGLTKNAATDSAKHDVRVNCLCPSYVDTPLVQRSLEGRPGARESVEKRTPMGRMAQPGEIADVAIFLSSPRSSYVTGVGWVVAGGGGMLAL